MKEFTIIFSQINNGKIDDQLLKHMTSLVKLDLNSNELTEIDEHAFSGLGNLEVIILRNNKLQRIPLNLFSGNGRLKEIDLRSNKLSKIHYGSFQFYSLETLLLSDNNCVDKDYWNKNELLYMVGDLREKCLRNYG
jgi:Leucine-rich repeat (LRR) protein